MWQKQKSDSTGSVLLQQGPQVATFTTLKAADKDLFTLSETQLLYRRLYYLHYHLPACAVVFQQLGRNNRHYLFLSFHRFWQDHLKIISVLWNCEYKQHNQLKCFISHIQIYEKTKNKIVKVQNLNIRNAGINPDACISLNKFSQ